MRNKPNLPDIQMDVTSILTRAYENKPHLRTPPKQTQFKANTNPIKPKTNPIKPNFKIINSRSGLAIPYGIVL